jgi:diguanylate cyclase (GGDEF)-like protein
MLLGRLKQFARGLLFRYPVTTEPISPDVIQRIQLSQLNGWVRISFVTVPVGVVIALTLIATYWSRRTNAWLDASFAGIMITYMVLFHFCRTWVRRKGARSDVMGHTRRLLAIRFVLGSFWGSALMAMMAVSDPMERSLVYGISVGLISTAVFGGPVIYALSFWLPLTLGAFGCVFATGTFIGFAPLITLIGYALLTFCAILYFDRQLIERSLTMIRLERHAETISILLRDFEESSSDWLWETDATLTMRHISPRFAEVALRQPQEMEINLIELLGGGKQASAEPFDRAIAILKQRIESHASFREVVVPVKIGAERRWWALTGKPLFDSNGSFIGYRGVGSDVTAAYRSRERIAYLARHDPLTDLANRAGFNEAIAIAVAEADRQNAALLCLDLDEFKTINDSYGHDIGDAVLRAVGQRIRGVLREHDFAARLGGDEFAVLLAVADKQEAAVVAARLIECLSPAFSCGDLVIKIGVSIGIAVAPADGVDPDTLYRNADLALYRAKAAGRGTWRLFDPNMDRLLHEKRLLQRDVRDALPNGELFVAYQPIVDLKTRELAALEALVRWHHPQRGIVPPADFVPIAEQSGLIGAIGTFVLTEAAELARRLPPQVRIAVNLSPLQLRDEGLLDRVHGTLNSIGLPPERIEFEVTESFMLETSGRSLENLRGLRSRGHCVAIDDFGTGYSSLAVLRGFPFDRLKIDRSFIANLEDEEGTGSIVKAIIGLGHALGLSVTAEGVESDEQADLLTQYGCADAQGYYFSRPLSPAQVMALLTPPGGGPLLSRVLLPAQAHPHASGRGRDRDRPDRRGSARLMRPHLVRNP